MYYLQKSVWYDLEYSFCQIDTFPDLNTEVLGSHGVCSVCSIDWLVSKISERQFTFSKIAVAEKGRQFNTTESNYGAVYFTALQKSPGFRANQRGPETKVSMDFAGGEVVAQSLRTHAGALIHVGALSRSTPGSAHVLAVYRRAGKYFMFDPNFGSYTCSYERGVAHWFNNVVNRSRPAVGTQPAKGAYSTWAASIFVLSYPI